MTAPSRPRFKDVCDAAVKALKDRYGSRDILMAGHVGALLALTPVKTLAYVERQRRLHDETAFRLNTLEGLGVAP